MAALGKALAELTLDLSRSWKRQPFVEVWRDCHGKLRAEKFFQYDSHLYVDYDTRPCYIASHPRSSRGVSGDILKAERGVASCGGGS